MTAPEPQLPSEPDGVERAAPPSAIPDTEQLMAELEAEVRARRASGELPADLERELDAAFVAVAPPGAVGGGFDAVVDRAEAAAFIETDAPTASRIPGAAFVKKVIRRVIAWYVQHVVHQVMAFATVTVRALRQLGERVARLEARDRGLDPRATGLQFSVADDLDVVPLADVAVTSLRGASGRVLHTECGDGSLLTRLADAGLDAYGTDPRDDAAVHADARSIEVRSQDALTHLRRLTDGALGGLILSGCTDRLPLGDQIELADRAAVVLAPGSAVVVIGTHPTCWARAHGAVVADLAPGRPLHADTWVQLLAARGFRDIVVRPDDAVASGATAVDDAADGADARLARLERQVFPSPAYAVTARR